MKNTTMCIALALFMTTGCSEEQRDELIKRTTKAAQELNGNSSSEAKEHTVPNIVAEQKRKENIRQNTTWTKENQALHPEEYCQAQLAELDKMAKILQVQVHSILTSKATADRKKSDAASQVESFTRLLSEAKTAYRKAEATNDWPLTLNGFQLSREKAEQKIVDVAQRISSARAVVAKSANLITTLEKKLQKLEAEQRRVIMVRESVQTTLSDVKTRLVVEGVNGIADALDAISDSMSSLGRDHNDPSIDDLVIIDTSAERGRLFAEIMAEE